MRSLLNNHFFIEKKKEIIVFFKIFKPCKCQISFLGDFRSLLRFPILAKCGIVFVDETGPACPTT